MPGDLPHERCELWRPRSAPGAADSHRHHRNVASSARTALTTCGSRGRSDAGNRRPGRSPGSTTSASTCRCTGPSGRASTTASTGTRRIAEPARNSTFGGSRSRASTSRTSRRETSHGSSAAQARSSTGAIGTAQRTAGVLAGEERGDTADDENRPDDHRCGDLLVEDEPATTTAPAGVSSARRDREPLGGYRRAGNLVEQDPHEEQAHGSPRCIARAQGRLRR